MSPNTLGETPRKLGLGDLPVELVVKIIGNLDFGERMRVIEHVCKDFHLLVIVGSLWEDIETCGLVTGRDLLGRVLLKLPEYSVKKVSIGSQFCSTDTSISILQALHSRNHQITSLTLDCAVVTNLWNVLKTEPFSINLKYIIELTINDDQTHFPWKNRYLESLIQIMNTMPKLTYFHHTSPTNCDASALDETCMQEIAFGIPVGRTNTYPLPARRSPMKHFRMPYFGMETSALVKLGVYFPELEVFEMGEISDMTSLGGRSGYDAMVFPESLCVFRVRNYVDSLEEMEVSSIFLKLLKTARGLEELEFKSFQVHKDEFYDLFLAAKMLRAERGLTVVDSLKLRKVVLGDWRIDLRCLVGEDSVWRCPGLVDATLRWCTHGSDGELGKPDVDLGGWKWEVHRLHIV